jgi:hypothetical protein
MNVLEAVGIALEFLHLAGWLESEMQCQLTDRSPPSGTSNQAHHTGNPGRQLIYDFANIKLVEAL